ncbi:iron(III) transport system ATP-binding protein [Terrimicrobium sacchariphilum]|jgi:iron(III) transport system ATP-binding protein|uniref:Iron(III) transport system ATP-binding protein n=1 Tax=Terrimicrobium sacchariphilum TaxID=690879 RepID=A0A146G7K3_TERSA|nr:ABC transporter ATP-binding protein [Terrimicrobium sacchariphilum]GAT33679.1 iron(III) transport system ATP-binding protein [Terrimicrobium sacchariphilum]
MIAISIESLTKRFGSHAALDDVSLRIEPGELFFLLGPSGCGKTTLLRTIAGFVTPDAGRVLFDREDVTKLPVHKRRTGMMFQSYALWPHLSVARNVAFGLEEQGVPAAEREKRVREALASVRMDSYAERKIGQLSGGQQQRVALARALVVRPRALLLDEPLSNLDAKLRLEMRSEIRRVCKEFGLTAVYVTHDQKEALSVADRLAVMSEGRIAQIGCPEEVYRRPHSRLVAEFIGETNILRGKVVSRAGEEMLVATAAGKFSARATGVLRTTAEEGVLVSIRPEGWRISDTGGENSIPAVLRSTMYLGEFAQHEFTAGGEALKALELNPHLAHRVIGRQYFLEPLDAVVLNDTP